VKEPLDKRLRMAYYGGNEEQGEHEAGGEGQGRLSGLLADDGRAVRGEGKVTPLAKLTVREFAVWAKARQKARSK
jgi:hypothetical protein